MPAAWLPAAAYGKYSLSETDVQGSANDANGAWAVAAVCRSERPLRVGLSRWLGSSAVDGFDEPRMAARGGKESFAPVPVNGGNAPISAVRETLVATLTVEY